MPPRLKPTRLEYVVDGVRLRAMLSAAALEASGDVAQRKAALDILKAALFRGRMIAKERLENGAGGIETARLLSGVTDEVITALWDFTTVHIFRARNPTEGERLALMAVGGYGRGTLAPYSDIDLLFVRPYKQTAHAESVIEYMLYALWDLGFKVGHASRTIEECVKLSRADFTIRTSILEARRLAGDENLAAELMRRFQNEVVKGTGAEFATPGPAPAATWSSPTSRRARAGFATSTPSSGSPSICIPASRSRRSCSWRCSSAARCAPSSRPSTSSGRCAATCTSPPAGRKSG
jgi:[protein-PII] uridylyltransferase